MIRIESGKNHRINKNLREKIKTNEWVEIMRGKTDDEILSSLIYV
jgi:hypothetical protein